jgi:hypothetical protein
VVAFVGATDQVAGAAEGGDDFSRTGQQRDDSLGGSHDR